MQEAKLPETDEEAYERNYFYTKTNIFLKISIHFTTIS